MGRADADPTVLAFPAPVPQTYPPADTRWPAIAPLPAVLPLHPPPSHQRWMSPIRPVEIGPPQPPLSTAGPTPSAPAISARKDESMDYTTRRFEPAGFPLIGGDSDIGFEFGAVGTLSRFADGIKPYSWNMDFVLSTSVKQGPKSVDFVQQSYLWNDDIVGLWGGRLRVNPEVFYQRTVNEGYFGLGNASSGVVPANYTGPAGRYFEWIDSIANAQIIPRLSLGSRGVWFATGALSYRFMDPSAYADSKVARDSSARSPEGGPLILGLRPLHIPALAVGVAYDSRDDEIFASNGSNDLMGVKYSQAIPTASQVRYGEAEIQATGFHKVGPFVFAGRITADVQFGNIPFYDLLNSGILGQYESIGGEQGVRGVPVGRYLGEIKVYGNSEIRTMFLRFSVFKQKFAMGADALFDAGRSWIDYSFRASADGHGLGLKYGVGGGLYFQWGQAALFRIDAAYSPDAAAENPHFPIGLYVADGTSF